MFHLHVWIYIETWKLIERKNIHDLVSRIELKFGNTVHSKIIRALEIIRVKTLIPKQFSEINFYQVMIFKLYTVYN